MKKFRFARPLVVGLISAGIAASATGSARAATATIGGGVGMYQYSPGDGQAWNDLRISFANGNFILEDRGVTEITVGSSGSCSRGAAPNIVLCKAVPGTTTEMQDQFWVNTGAYDDVIQLDASLPRTSMDAEGNMDFAFIVNAGSEDDYLSAVNGAWLTGSWGNDNVIGGPGDDVLSGGEGNDVMRGGAGTDRVHGSAGRDSFTYNSEGRTAGIRAVADGSTRSGREGVDGFGDIITSDVEDLSGTPYTDILTGNTSNNVLRGNGGVDQITGLAGDDTLIATGGPSWLDGGDGNDSLQAKNTFKDYLGCGNGTDTAKVDPTELFVPFASCETLTS